MLGVLGALEPRKYRDAVHRASALAVNTTGRASRSVLVGAEMYEGRGRDTTGQDGGANGQEEQGLLDGAELMAPGFMAPGPFGSPGAKGGGTGGEAGSERGWMLEEFAPGSPVHLAGFALMQLLSILHDQTLTAYHHRVIAALVYVFTSLGEQCAPFLPRVMPTLLAILLRPTAESGPPTGIIAQSQGYAPVGVNTGGGTPGSTPRSPALSAMGAPLGGPRKSPALSAMGVEYGYGGGGGYGGGTGGGGEGGAGGGGGQGGANQGGAGGGCASPCLDSRKSGGGGSVASLAEGSGGSVAASRATPPVFNHLLQQLPALVATMRCVDKNECIRIYICYIYIIYMSNMYMYV